MPVRKRQVPMLGILALANQPRKPSLLEHLVELPVLPNLFEDSGNIICTDNPSLPSIRFLKLYSSGIKHWGIR